jgi:hypothetical protein
LLFPSLGRSELEACLAGSVSQCLDTTVIGKAGAIEGDLFDGAARAFSAMRLPTRVAAAALPPLPPSCSRTSFSAVEALASTRVPSSDTTLA